MILIKLKAGALQLTLFIIVVIALLLAAFVLIINSHQRFKLQTHFVKNSIEQTNNGIRYSLNNEYKKHIINENSVSNSNTILSKTYWGLFEKVVSKNKIKTIETQKVALIGAKQPEFNRVALYIKENNNPLVVVGNTKIKGLSYLPKRGVKAGTITGQSYTGTKLIYGPKLQSFDLPKLKANYLDHLKQLKKIDYEIPRELVLSTEKERNHKNSFFNPTKYIVSKSAIHLSEIRLIGNIIVKSESKIYVEATSQLKDVIIIAPEIVIKSNVTGTFQAIASKKIKVENNVTLAYPSALVLINENQIENNNNSKAQEQIISINKNNNINGIVISITPKKSSHFKPQIFINDQTTITGEVYCNQNIELLGTIKGSLFTSNCIANQFGSVYQNHLYNAKIDISALNINYSGLLFKNAKKNVAKWLY